MAHRNALPLDVPVQDSPVSIKSGRWLWPCGLFTDFQDYNGVKPATEEAVNPVRSGGLDFSWYEFYPRLRDLLLTD